MKWYFEEELCLISLSFISKLVLNFEFCIFIALCTNNVNSFVILLQHIAILMLVQVYFFWECDVMGSTTVVHSTTLGYDTQLDELRVLNAQLESKVTALEALLPSLRVHAPE